MSSVSYAQVVSPVDFMRNNPRAAFSNPAFFTSDYGFFDLGLGGINIGVQNIGLKYDNFFRFNSNGQPTAILLDQGVASLRNVNYLNTFLNFDIFNCGRRTRYGFFTYTHRLREMQSLSYNKDLVQLLANGNASFLGENNPANIKIGLAARLFQEFDFGYQMCLTDQWNIGVRFKFLMGFIDAKTNSLNAKLFTDPDTYALTLMADAGIRAALPYKLTMDNGNIQIADKRFNIANLFKNYGMGFDLGGEYKIDDQWGVAAAINDLGVISWKNYAVSLEGGIQDGGSFYQNGGFHFAGITNEQVSGMLSDPQYLNKLVDSLSNYLQLNPQNLVKYTSGLNGNMMVRGYYDLTPEHRFSAQFTGYNLGLGVKPAFTMAYTGSFAEKYDVVATYTMMPGSCDNIGIGLSANFGGLLLYIASNNVFGFFNPANRSMLHAQFGISFTSGEKITRAETVIIKDQIQEQEEQNEEQLEAPQMDTEMNIMLN